MIEVPRDFVLIDGRAHADVFLSVRLVPRHVGFDENNAIQKVASH